jgi:hypothetical protein
LLDPALDRCQRRRQGRGIGATGLRHVGTAAALAADLPGDEIHQLTGLELAGVIRRDPGDQADLAVAGAGKHDGTALLSLSLSLSSVSRKAAASAPSRAAASTLMPLTSAAWLTSSSPWDEASFALSRASSFSSAGAFLDLRHTRSRLGGLRLDFGGDGVKQRLLLLHAAHRDIAADGLDATHPGGHAGLHDDLEQADVAGTGHVRAAAEFAG